MRHRYVRGNCQWCEHPWINHDAWEGCDLYVGAGNEVGLCPCTVTNEAHGRALDEIERLRTQARLGSVA